MAKRYVVPDIYINRIVFRVPKTTSWRGSTLEPNFETFEDARSFLIGNREQELRDADDNAKRALRQLQKARVMTPKTAASSEPPTDPKADTGE